jgi:hypothetical protein
MQIKKYLATGLSAVMAGATMGGAALAQTSLSDYPDFLGNNGQIDTFVVVGADAQPADIVGAGDVVAGLSSLSYTMVGTSGGVVTTTSGGKTEDMNIGLNLNETTAFGGTLDDSDISSFADSEVTFSIGGSSETYDYHEELRLGNGALGTISVETGLTADKPDEDFKDDIFLQVLPGAVEYRLVFDEDLKSGTNITDATNSDPIELTFMGRDLIITSATTNSITVDVGERFFLNAGESAVTSDGKTVTLVKAVSSTKAQITVNGASDIISEDNVKSVGGTEVKVTDVADDDGIEFDSAIVIVGTAATFGEATDTFDDGEEFIIPCGTLWSTEGCDEDDADWVWNLENLQAARPVMGVVFDERIDSPDDNPPAVGTENNVLDLPGGFAWISLDRLTTNSYQDYEISDKTKDLKDAAGNTEAGGVSVIEFHGEGNDDSFTISGVGDTDNIYFGVHNDTFLQLYWEDSNDGNKVKRFTQLSGNGTSSSAFSINYEGATVPVDLVYDVDDIGGAFANVNVSLTGSVGSNSIFYIRESGADSGDFDYVGQIEGDTTANDIRYGTLDISSYEEDTRTPDGLKIYDPEGNDDSDKYKFGVPAEFGSNDFQIFVTIGSSGTTTSTSGSSGSIKQLVPITTSLTKLDTEVGAAEKAKNLVVIGGPAVNRITAEAMSLPYPSFGAASGIEEGTALISIIDDAFTTGKAAVIVAGYEADNTRLATQVLQQAATKLAGVSASSATVSGASVASAVITAQ